MKKRVKQLVSLMLVLALVVSGVPHTAYAAAAGEIPAAVHEAGTKENDAAPAPEAAGTENAADADPPAAPLPQEPAKEMAGTATAEVIASGTCGDRLGWILTDDGVLTISGDGPMTDFTFNQSSGISAGWNSYRSQIVEVVLPDGITTVGNNAFRSCSNLERINFPAGITKIGTSALAYGRKIREIEIPGSCVTIGGSAFFQCSGMETAVFGNGVADLGNSAFSGCSALASVTLPASLRNIGSNAFLNATSLTALTISASLTRIGEMAFKGSGLTELNFLGFAPSQGIGENAFEGLTLTVYYPGLDVTWTEEIRQQYGGTVRWVPVVRDYDITIAGTGVTDANLSGLIDNTLAWRYDPSENTLHLQGYYRLPADYAFNYLISASVSGLKIQLDHHVTLEAPAGKTDFRFFLLFKDTVITRSGDYDLTLVGNGEENCTGIYSSAKLTLDDVSLYMYGGVTYGLDGGTGWSSALEIDSSEGNLICSTAAIFRFPRGVSLTNCCFIRPFSPVIGSDGVVYEDYAGGTMAAHVTIGQGPYALAVDGVTVSESNKDNILGDIGATFRYSPNSQTLYINGSYQGRSSSPVIENYINGLTIYLNDVCDLSTTGTSQTMQGLIVSQGDLKIVPADDTCPMTLVGSGVFNRAGIQMLGGSRLTLEGVDLTVTNTGYGLRGDTEGAGSSLVLSESRYTASGIATSGIYSFTGGVTLTECAFAAPAYPVVRGGSVMIETWDGDRLVPDVIVYDEVYDLVIDGVRVWSGNAYDVLSNGIFSYAPDDGILTISGSYSQPTATAETLRTYRIRPVIDNGIDGLKIELTGDVTLTSALENYNSYTPVINSTSRQFVIREAEGAGQMPVLTLTGADGIAYDGIHSKSLMIRGVDLRVTQGARKGILGESGSDLSFVNACADIWGTSDEGGAAVTGFTGGIILDDCAILNPGASVSGGAVVEQGEPAGRVIVSNAVYDLIVDGVRLSAEHLSALDGTVTYDPESNTLTLLAGGADVLGSTVPVIENHIPDLTIVIASGFTLGTTASEGGQALIESDGNVTVRSADGAGRLVVDGNGVFEGIRMRSGASLTIEGAYILIRNVTTGLAGSLDSVLHFKYSLADIHASSAAAAGFTGGITLTSDVIVNAAHVDGAGIYDDATGALATDVEIRLPEHDGHDNINFIPWTSEDSLPTEPGSYCLYADVTLTEEWVVPDGTVDLCLNGHNITSLALSSCRLIYVRSDTTLNLYDCSETPGRISGGHGNLGGGVYIYTGTLNMYGGEIRGNVASTSGGGVYIDSGTFNLIGGSVKNNAADTVGGGVYVNAAGIFKMTGGSVTGNTAGTRGGGVYVLSQNGTSFRVSGTPTVTDNIAHGAPNNVYLYEGKKIGIAGRLAQGASIGVSMDYPDVFTASYDLFNSSTAPAAFFTSDDSSYGVGLNDGEGALTEVMFRVTFDVQGHGTAPDQQTIGAGSPAFRPADPAEEGWIFEGWYTDADCTAAYDFITPLSADLTLYAKWRPAVTGLHVWLGETEVTDANMDDILGDGTARYDPETHTLTFTVREPNITGVHVISVSDIIFYDALIAAEGVDLTVVTAPEGLKLSTVYSGIMVRNGSLTVEGSPEITCIGSSAKFCLYAYSGNITVNGGAKLTASNRGNEFCYAMYATSGSILVDGDLVFSSRGYGLEAFFGNIDITGFVTGTTGANGSFEGGNCLYTFNGDITVGGDADLKFEGTGNYAVIYSKCTAGEAYDITVHGTLKAEGITTGFMVDAESGTLTVDKGMDVRTTADYGKAVRAAGGIVFPEDYMITVPADGTVSEIEFGGDRYYTVTAAGSETPAPHVVVRKNPLAEIDISHGCAFGNDLSISYYVENIPEIEGSTMYLVVEKDVWNAAGTEKTVRTTVITDYTVGVENGHNVYRFVYRGIAAKEMGDELRARLVMEETVNGETVTYRSGEDVYSARVYCYNRIAASTDAHFRTLLVDLLNYGAAAQTYFNYRTNAPVNADLTPEQQALGTQEDITNEGVPEPSTTPLSGTPKVIWTGKNAVFGSNIEIKYYFELAEGVEPEDVRLRLRYTSVDGSTKTTTLNASDALYSEADHEYALLFAGVAAKDMGQQVSAWFIDANSRKVSDTVLYGLENYFFNRLEKSTDENFKVLIRAVLKYSRSAKAYFESRTN